MPKLQQRSREILTEIIMLQMVGRGLFKKFFFSNGHFNLFKNTALNVC